MATRTNRKRQVLFASTTARSCSVRAPLVLPLLLAVACSNADFGGTAGKTGTPSRAAAGSTPGAGTQAGGASPTPPPTGAANSTDASNAGSPSPSLSGSGSGGGTVQTTGDSKSCTLGCCPSQKIAFVDCAGGSPVPLKPGSFAITQVTCDQSASPAALKDYDTIVYYGPAGAQGRTPAGIDAALSGGSKVLAFIPAGSSGLFAGFYSLMLETALEFLSNIGGSTIHEQNHSQASGAFDQHAYSAANISYFMRSTAATEPLWCSSLVATSAIGLQTTTFHAYLLDSPARRGLMLLTTLTQPSGKTGFDFSEPFLAAQLSQTWNRAGNSAACGLPCGGGNTISVGGGSATPPTSSQPGNGFTTATGVGKPVVYLYPTKEETVTVKLDFDGQLVTTYPSYNNKLGGWRVRATPQGQIFDPPEARDPQEYSYIYWNGTTNAFIPDFRDGFVVRGEQSRLFLQKALAKLGMTPREANDMIVYWLPYLEKNPYNLIHFAGEEYTRIAKMDISPKPDSLLRVFMVFKKIDQPIAIKPQVLRPFERKGFSVVEWGGTEINGSWHIVK